MIRPVFPASLLFLVIATAPVVPLPAAEATVIRVLSDIGYKTGDAAGLSDYEKERCLLDVYLPAEGGSFATLVWFARTEDRESFVADVEAEVSFARGGVGAVALEAAVGENRADVAVEADVRGGGCLESDKDSEEAD